MTQTAQPISLAPSRSFRFRRAHHGQTLVIVLAVMFVLLLIGGIFVAQIARNLTATGATRDGQAARDLAEAGVRYCDEQLTTSVEGADWRPTPTIPLTTAADPNGLTDPDYYWLGGLGGFTRIPLKGGRVLVRVSYEPQPDDPRSNLIKIEAVGRVGELGTNDDPTVFVQKGSAPKLRRELVAYKQIGLTDYGRYITNKNRTFPEATLGVASTGLPITTVLGDPTLGTNAGANGYNNSAYLLGYPIRSNTTLKFVGDVFLYHSARNNNQPLLSNEGIQTTGDLAIEPTRDTNADGAVNELDRQVFLNQDIANGVIDTAKILFGTKEKDPNTNEDLFTTLAGRVRDGQNRPDAIGYIRNIPRLEPPNLDTLASGTGVLRYRQLTRDSGAFRVDANGQRYNTGQIGWGRGVYVDNREDLQPETKVQGTVGGYSLRSDWLNPNARDSHGYWQKPFYRPPGVQIELLQDRIRLTRSDNGQFHLPNNEVSDRNGGKVIDIPLGDAARKDYTLPDGTRFALQTLDHDGDNGGMNSPYKDKLSYGVNLVIMAEGNVRVKGAYGATTNLNDGAEAPNSPVSKLGRVHLTIVSGGTAYIEGNVVKTDGYIDAAGGSLERGSTCAILAKDYVCVNTTMFFSPQNDTTAWTQNPPDLDAFNVELGTTRPSYDLSFSSGVVRPKYKTNGAASQVFLLLRHASVGALTPGGGPSYINLLINPGLPVNGLSPTPLADDQYLNTTYPFNSTAKNSPQFGALPSETYRVGETDLNGVDIANKTPFEIRAFSLSQIPAPTFQEAATPGVDNLFRFQTDQTLTNRIQALGLSTSAPNAGIQNYLLGGMSVVPLDIRIEAVLYAQERSFFVIPGYGFNPDPRDSRAAWVASNPGTPALRVRPSYNFDVRNVLQETAETKLAKDIIPFYGEPMDVRITLVGSISENYTAAIGDQTAWMQRWGYIPQRYGSSDIPIPDIHLFGVDDNTGDAALNAYSPGTAQGIDFRSPAEKNAEIAHGLRYQYDSALAFPYFSGLVNNLTLGDQRAKLALRHLSRPVMDGNNVPKYYLHQILPPVPKLPMCPGLLYFGEPDRRIGGAMTQVQYP